MQTKLGSLIEQILNIGSGFIISYFIWDLVLKPAIVAGQMSVHDTFGITFIFTVVSVVRGYLWRRLFNYFITKRSRSY